ncbi:hypothetical protein KIN20_013152 [Parelaphostrongylus tenuis]|uniref:Edg1 TPR repeats region domain-containing protein n=1 Tax=Parelaphostrongylus tenuis TaxID=148309 RepID=A0AAD5MF47_PARTN|nr:hypothetical protein KIN20_013152 [Parelaphostrongylus tenuis]
MLENFFQGLSEESRSYSTDVTKCVNGIGDHNGIQSQPEKFNYIRKKLSWYLFTVPGPTLRRLLSQCMQNKSIVPGVFEHKVLGVEYSPILIESIMILFDDEIDRLQSMERARTVRLLVNLSLSGIKEELPSDSSREGDYESRRFWSGCLFYRDLMQSKHETLMLKLLQRMDNGITSEQHSGVHDFS